MDINEALKAEAAARAKGGVVLGQSPAMPPPPGSRLEPEALMKLAAARIHELEEQAGQVQAMVSTIANLFTATLAKMAEASDKLPPDGEIVVVLDGDIVKRADGARVRILPQEDGAFAVAVVLPENFELYETVHAEKNQTELEQALGLSEEEQGEVQEGA